MSYVPFATILAVYACIRQLGHKICAKVNLPERRSSNVMAPTENDSELTRELGLAAVFTTVAGTMI